MPNMVSQSIIYFYIWIKIRHDIQYLQIMILD